MRRVPAQDRPKKRGQGVIRQQAEAQLAELIDGKERPIAGKVAEVTATVERLLGLTVEQFKQVLLLPQGEFRELLLARSADKEILLERLFGTAFYKEVAERLGATRWALEARCRELDLSRRQILEGRGVASEAGLAETIAGALALVRERTHAAEQTGVAARRAGDRHARAQALATALAARQAAVSAEQAAVQGI